MKPILITLLALTLSGCASQEELTHDDIHFTTVFDDEIVYLHDFPCEEREYKVHADIEGCFKKIDSDELGQEIKDLEARISYLENKPEVMRYEQIKDTMRTKKGEIFRYIDRTSFLDYNKYCKSDTSSPAICTLEPYSEDGKLTFKSSCIWDCYTKEEVQNEEFFKPLN